VKTVQRRRRLCLSLKLLLLVPSDHHQASPRLAWPGRDQVRQGEVTVWRCDGVTAWRCHGVTASRRHGVTAWRRHGVTAWRRHGVTVSRC